MIRTNTMIAFGNVLRVGIRVGGYIHLVRSQVYGEAGFGERFGRGFGSVDYFV